MIPSDLLRRAVGRSLTRVRGTFLVREGVGDEDPLAVWLTLGPAEYRFFGDADGWGLSVDQTPPQTIDMQELGRIEPREMTAFAGVASFVSTQLTAAAAVASKGGAETIGVSLHFGARRLLILNWGDEMYISEVLPRDAAPGDIYEVEFD